MWSYALSGPKPIRSTKRLRSLLIGLGLIVANIGCSSQGVEKKVSDPKSGNVKTFVNSRAGVANSRSSASQALARDYVDFSFDYPASWELLRHGVKGNVRNFVQVRRVIPGDKSDEVYPLEDLGVGSFVLNGAPEDAEAQFSEVAEKLSSQLAAGFPNYRKSSQGPTSIGEYRGFQILFTARIDATPKGPITLWGRIVFVLPAGASNRGVLLQMIATSLAPEFASEQDVGHKGELPIILNSLILASSAGERK